MIRLLTAVLLLASFNAVAEVTLTEISNDEVADADEVMGNFNALKQGVEANAAAIGALPSHVSAVWVDANGEVVGYPPPDRLQKSTADLEITEFSISVRLPETDMVFWPSYSFELSGPGNIPNVTRYLYGAEVKFPERDCEGEAVIWAVNKNGQSAAPFGVTWDGYYAYAGEETQASVNGEVFDSYSYSAVDEATGEVICRNRAQGILSYSEVIKSSKAYAAPLAEPVILRWR